MHDEDRPRRMAVSLRTSLVLVVVVTSMVPIGALAWYEANEGAEHAEALHAAEHENAALAAATRIESAVARGDASGAAGPGSYLVARDGTWTASDGRSGVDPRLADMLGASLSGVAQGADPVTGEERTLSWARVPALDQAVLLAAPPATFPVRPEFLGVVLPLALGVVVIAVVLTQHVIRPLAHLERASRRLADGDWSHPVHVAGGAELRSLARAFNGMAEELTRQRAALERYASDTRGDIEAVNFAVAHELREPLRSMRTLAAVVEEDGDPQEARRTLALLRKRLEHLERVVLDLLRFDDLGRRPLAPTKVDLGHVVDDAARAADVAVEREPLPTAVADETLLREAVTQVFRNVAEHARGPVRVSARVEGGRAVLDFDDAGPGIPAARREDAFHLFQRLRPDGAGTGVGLAIVRRVAALHGGEARLEDAPGGGTRLEFALALDGPPPRPDVAASASRTF